MANGDPLAVGLNNNRANSTTLLVTNGSAFGDPRHSFWVMRTGAPPANTAILGQNFSPAAPNQFHAGIMGQVRGDTTGVIGAAGALGPPLLSSDTGVLGIANSHGVVGRALSGMLIDDGRLLYTATGVAGDCPNGVGVFGRATSGIGMIGESAQNTGVNGASDTGVGVSGQSNRATGVLGTSTSGIGVAGDSTQGTGVRGRSVNAIGVEGDSVRSPGVFGRSVTSIGVEGTSGEGMAGVLGSTERMYGVLGRAASGVGVAGVSATNAVQGLSTGSSGASIGVFGLSAGGAGVLGASTTGDGIQGRSRSGYAGRFDGNVIVYGSFSVVGGTKSAVVRHRDGSHRALYCLESPESYFEDFGEARLVRGTAKVKLDAGFAALIRRSNYQVFLTSYGPAPLYVKRRTSQSFEIAVVPGYEGKGGKVFRCGYRIVARRADVRAARLPRVKLREARRVSAGQVRQPLSASTLKRSLDRTVQRKPAPFPKAPGRPRFPKLPAGRLPNLPTAIDVPLEEEAPE